MSKSAKGMGEQRGRNVKAKSSKRCACWCHTEKANRLSQSRLEWLECGYTGNADIHGARKFLAAGHAVLASVGMVQSVRPPVEAGTHWGDSGSGLNAVEIPVL